MKHVSDSPLGPKGLIKAAESPEFCCGCYGCGCCCFFLSAFCLLYVCSLFFCGSLRPRQSDKPQVRGVCNLLSGPDPGPWSKGPGCCCCCCWQRHFRWHWSNKTVVIYIFFLPNCCCDPKAFYVMAGTHNPPHLNEAQLEPTPREDALTIITLASSTRPGRPSLKVYSLYSLLLFQHYFKCYFPYLGIDK